MKKKRMPALLLGCLLTAGLTACGGPQADPENDPSVQLPNPMVAYEDARFPDYEITGYPDREGMTPTAFYLIGGALAEIDYENAVLRVDGITENERDISGLYLTDPPVESELTVPHSCCDRLISVTVKQYTEGTLAAWDSCGDPFTWTLWLPGQTAEQARALIEEVVAGVLVRMPDAGESLAAPEASVQSGIICALGDPRFSGFPTDWVVGTQKELDRWEALIRSGKTATIAVCNMNAYEAELSAEDARAIVKTLADAELKLFDRVGNPATGGSFQVIAYDASGSVLFCSYYDGEWFGVTFEGDENGYIFNGKGSGLDALALPPQN